MDAVVSKTLHEKAAHVEAQCNLYKIVSTNEEHLGGDNIEQMSSRSACCLT